MQNILLIGQIITCVLLITAIQLQSRGGGLGSTGSGGANYHSRRGLEKILLRATVVLVIMFMAISILALL